MWTLEPNCLCLNVAVPLSSGAILGRSLHLSVPWFAYLSNKDKNSPYFAGLWKGGR